MEGTEKQGAEVDYKVNISNPPQAEQTQPEETSEVQAEEQVQAEGNEEQVQEQVEQPQAEEQAPEEPQQQETAEEAPAMSREELFNQLLQTKYNMGADELENVLTNSTQAQELPEEVKAYMEYHKETKRGLNDYLRLQQDFSQVPDSQLLREYYKQTKQGLDDNDVNALLDLKFGYDEGAEQSVITSKTLEMKEELFKAKQFFEGQKEKYKKPLESSTASVSEEQQKAVEFYNKYREEQTAQEARQKRSRESFSKKTQSYFNDDFKGFEFKVGDDKLLFKPKDIQTTKRNQSDLVNFVNQHTDANGELIDAQKYHTALSMAMNPEAYAKFFYEQGRSSAVNSVVTEGKNIDMDVRSSVQSSQPQPKFRVLDSQSPFFEGLKIKKR